MMVDRESDKPATTKRIDPAWMLTGPIIGPLMTLAAPTVAVLVAQTLVGIAETFYVGRLGTDALAGAALVFPISMLMAMMANGGIGGGVSSAVARATGAGRRADADALVLHALVLAILFGAGFTAAAMLLGRRLYSALGGSAGALDAAVTYSAFVFAASVPTWTTNLMAAALRGVGNVRVPALVTMVGCVVMVLLSPVLIFGLGPIPGFGVAGAGLAIMIYYVGATLYLGAYLASGRGGLTLRFGPLQWRLFADVLKVGLISAVGTLIANLTVIVVTGLIGRFGTYAIAGYGAASRLDYAQIPFLFGLGTAVVTMVGVNYGAGQFARARRIAWIGALIAAAACEALGLFAASFPDLWMGIFSRDPMILSLGASYLHRVAPAYGAVGLGMLLYFAAQGTGRMLTPFVAGLSRLGVAAGLGWIAVARFDASLPTLFLTVAAGAIAFGAVNAFGMMFARTVGKDSHAVDRHDDSRRETRMRAHGRFYAPKIALGGAAAVALTVASFVAVSGQTKNESVTVRLPVVRAARVAPADLGGPRFTGVVHARYESALGFRVSGKILERLVDPGVRVRKAQPLMRLDPTDFALALKAAHQAVEAARATATQAASDEKRRRTLVAQGWVTPQAYEQNKALADASAAQLQSALLQEKQAEDQASYAVLEADSDGVVMDVPSDPGQVVAAGQTVVRLAHDGPREAEVYLPEGNEQMAGNDARAALYAKPGATVPAKLRELSAMADPATRTYRARFVLGGADQQAPLGATVTLRLSRAPGNGALYVIPVGALFDAGHGPCVWVIDPGTSIVRAQPVTVVRIGEERATVSSGLVEGQRVVALGAHLLKAGDKVEVADTQFGSADQ